MHANALCLNPASLNLADFGTLFDLENDLPDELIPNGDASLLNSGGNLVADAASKHKQLSELLRGGSGSSLNPGLGSVSSGSPIPHGVNSQVPGQPNSMAIGSPSVMGKSPLSQGEAAASSLAKQAVGPSGASSTPTPQSQKPVGMVTSSPAPSQAGTGICMNAGFGQAHAGLLSSNSGHSLMNQAQQGPGQVINGSLGAAGRGRGAGMPYSASTLQGNAGSVLAETLTQVSSPMAGHAGLSTAQAGALAKVRSSSFQWWGRGRLCSQLKCLTNAKH